MIEEKINKLDSILNELKSFVVAFSGGVDSSFLLHRSHSLKIADMIGITIRTPYIPEVEIDDAVGFAKSHGINHTVIDLPFPEQVRNNPIDRCYICKKTLFSELRAYAEKNGYSYVIEGTNADDTGDYRPGLKALRELEIRSPLLESGLSKNEIRELLHRKALPVWDKPALACLLTRIPYDTTINDRMLRMIEQAEYLLLEKGYPGSRVRIHGDLARIECPPALFEKIIQNPDKELIISNLKKIGFRFISLDLEGYRTGSLNPDIKHI